jgi:quinol monooxygenase YgiN
VQGPHYLELDRAKFALTVRFHVKAEHVGTFAERLRRRVVAARRDEAVVDFRLFTTDAAHVFVVFESFTSRAAWTAFSKHPDTVAFLASVAPLQAAPYAVQFLDLVELP